MLISIVVATLLTTVKIAQTDSLKTTLPVSMILDGITLEQWNERSLWNQTCPIIVHHLNEFCKKDYLCDAEYGIANVHLMHAVQYSLASIQLNITADKPVLSMTTRMGNTLSLYNYTGLLTRALLQTKIDIERSNEGRLFFTPNYSNENSFVSRTSRLLFVLLGILLVATVFGLTVLFFQRIRQHSYSKLLKIPRIYQTTQDDPLTDAPSTAALHQ
ncbi:unnamed protein product [Adineta ricciae]|uniref:Uncharacterized protein n=1 Tax=Adineta ricciae TaxID=249248 RepID=A0A815AGP0_ADIRI|nr:unnamed protein product [Adineta ricciae]CAF1267542.1 unnamed protein product [Adineta ricciae]